jgi:AraC-like DNA-binding protein
MVNNIIEFIDTNYMMQDMGLYKVASSFNISEGYLSYFFKEQTGVNFTDYVEKVRMGYACELLKDKNLTIIEVSEKVGYNSVQSFRRAFKRIKGVSPSAMRE